MENTEKETLSVLGVLASKLPPPSLVGGMSPSPVPPLPKAQGTSPRESLKTGHGFCMFPE